MEINGLTEEQVEMLDFMWNELNTFEDYHEWYLCLDKRQQQMADTLQNMVILGAIDDDFEEMKTFPDATKVLERFIK